MDIYSREAEESVIGSLLVYNERYQDIGDTLSSDDFYFIENRVVFKALKNLLSQGKYVDGLILYDELKKNKSLESHIDAELICKYSDAASIRMSFLSHVKMIKEKKAMRDLFVVTERLRDAIGSNKDKDMIYSIIGELQDSSRSVFIGNMPTNLFSMGQDVIDMYHRIANGEQGIPLPWSGLNKLTNGLWTKTFSYFVARPGIGKSTVAVLIPVYCCLNAGITSLIVSPEMSKIELAERSFAYLSKIDSNHMISGSLSEFDYPKLENTVKEFSNKTGINIIDSDDDLTPSGIESYIRACGAKLVVVDSVYSLNIPGERRDRAVRATEWIVKAAKRLDVVMVGFGQQNREAEKTVKMGGGSRLGTIALADELSQDTYNIYALEQTIDDIKDKIMRIKPLKIRRGSKVKKDYKINWDWTTMNFTEIENQEEDGDFSDDIPF